jgi:hypothetical protein
MEWHVDDPQECLCICIPKTSADIITTKVVKKINVPVAMATQLETALGAIADESST